MIVLETIKSFSIISVTLLASIGILILYFSIFLSIRRINKLNKKIEENQRDLDEIEIREKRDGILFRSRQDELTSMKIEKTIKRLQREKKYILEKISIFKIFKK